MASKRSSFSSLFSGGGFTGGKGDARVIDAVGDFFEDMANRDGPKFRTVIDASTDGLVHLTGQTGKLSDAFNSYHDSLQTRTRALNLALPTSTLDRLGGAIARIVDLTATPYSPASRVYQGISAGFSQGNAAGGITTALMGATGGLVSGFQAAGAAILKWVEASNPASVLRFGLALRDVTAVIGRALAPVLDVVTAGLRLLGDFLASVLPTGDQMRAALRPVTDLFNELREPLARIGELFRAGILIYLELWSIRLRLIAELFRPVIAILEGLLGKSEGPMKSSVGAAVRNATFTSPEQAARSIYSAILMSAAKDEDKNKKPNTTRGWLEKIADVLGDIADVVRSIFSAIADFVGLDTRPAPRLESPEQSGNAGEKAGGGAPGQAAPGQTAPGQAAPSALKEPSAIRRFGHFWFGTQLYPNLNLMSDPLADLDRARNFPSPTSPLDAVSRALHQALHPPAPKVKTRRDEEGFDIPLDQGARPPRLEVPQSGRPFDARVGLQRHFFPEEFSNPDLARRSDALLEQAQKLARAGNPELAQRILNTPQSAAPGTAPASLVRDMEQAFERALRRVHHDPAEMGRRFAREERGP